MLRTFMMLLLVAAFSGIHISASKNTSSSHSISLDCYNLQNNKGYLYISLYNNPKQYPFKHFKVKKTRVNMQHLKYSIFSLKPGHYATSIVGNENANADPDRFIGTPTEKYGFSNKKARGRSRNIMKFNLKEKKKHLTIKVQYT
ncbi:MAG: DUF2141 domain-containing protein [Crocinitomicaceae bacterium]|nr:DUF2141 domain-containing protein [Flavobacteriales bacterium]NQZ37654.1 DUF2141 domain-containing protein [Crocinitomicaceae bacterium]